MGAAREASVTTIGSDAANVAMPKVVGLVGARHAAPAGDACVAPTNPASDGHAQDI